MNDKKVICLDFDTFNKMLDQPSLRDQFAMAADEHEIDRIIPSSAGDVCRFIGLDINLNQPGVKYPEDAYLKAIVKARYIWADAMLKARG